MKAVSVVLTMAMTVTVCTGLFVARAAQQERRQGMREALAERIQDLNLTDNEMMKIGDIRDEYRPKIRAALKQLVGVLNDDQKKTREEALKAGKKRSEIRESLSLSADQKEKLESIGKDLRALVGEEMEKIRDVVTPEQQETIQAAREETGNKVRDRLAWRIANLKELNLSAEQVSKINDIRKEYRPKVHEAGNAFRTVIRDELAKILAVIKQ